VTASGQFRHAITAAELRSQVEENLRRLGRDHLDVVNLRIVRKSGQDSIAERFGALAEMRERGLIRHLGISNVRIDHLDEAEAIAPVVCVQNSFAIDNRKDDDLLAACGRRGVAAGMVTVKKLTGLDLGFGVRAGVRGGEVEFGDVADEPFAGDW
jgi:aryl-alcohol dehydrogenase-like predicted oxidoreductase